jgi:hypothetical protein
MAFTGYLDTVSEDYPCRYLKPYPVGCHYNDGAIVTQKDAEERLCFELAFEKRIRE